MKGILFYFSSTGNTELMCKYLSHKITHAEVKCVSMEEKTLPDLEDYDIIGFAAFTDYMAPSPFVKTFFQRLPDSINKPGFVLCTCGNMYGKTLQYLKTWAEKKGVSVFTGHGLHTPENYPYMIKNNMAFENAPDEKELNTFHVFIGDLDSCFKDIDEGKKVKARKISMPWLYKIIPASPRFVARWMIGKKFVDKERCTQCGLCQKKCVYDVISCNPYPEFNEKKCQGCYSCYNHCPVKAIYTSRFRDMFHYSEPNDTLKRKLSLEP